MARVALSEPSEHDCNMDRVSTQLCECIRRIDPILARLNEGEAITTAESERIRGINSTYASAQQLIGVIRCKPATAYRRFLQALTETNQNHLRSLLEDPGFCLNTGHQDVLKQRQVYLREHLDVSTSHLLPLLLQSEVLNEEETAKIKNEGAEQLKADQLIELMMRSSQDQYQQFLKALDDSSQQHVAQELKQTQVMPRDDFQLPEVPSFRSDSFLDHTKVDVDIIEVGHHVEGLTVIENKLFLVHEKSPDVEVYDLNSMKLTHTIHVSNMTLGCPKIVGCSHHSCLYVSKWNVPRFDHEDHGKKSTIYRVNLHDNSVVSWEVDGGCNGLSITTDHNLLVTITNLKQVREYTTGGVLERIITFIDSLEYPLHSIRLSNGNFVVCDNGLEFKRVCIADDRGQRILESFGGSPGSAVCQLKGSLQLAVDKYDYVFVVDSDNHRVHLLSPQLRYLGDVQTKGHQLKNPLPVHLDEINRRLVVGELYDGRVIVIRAANRSL